MRFRETVVEVVRQYCDGGLIHETDVANLRSIEQHGLLSKDEAFKRGVMPVLPGGDDLTQSLDYKHGLGDYVFLSLLPNRLMPKHNERYSWRRRTLRIDPGILFLNGSRIALGCANHRDTEICKLGRAFHAMDGEAMCWVYDQTGYDENNMQHRMRLRQVWRYEALVLTCVPPEYILGVGAAPC